MNNRDIKEIEEPGIFTLKIHYKKYLFQRMDKFHRLEERLSLGRKTDESGTRQERGREVGERAIDALFDGEMYVRIKRNSTTIALKNFQILSNHDANRNYFTSFRPSSESNPITAEQTHLIFSMLSIEMKLMTMKWSPKTNYFNCFVKPLKRMT